MPDPKLGRAKVPFSRRNVSRNWHRFLHTPEESIDIELDRSNRDVAIPSENKLIKDFGPADNHDGRNKVDGIDELDIAGKISQNEASVRPVSSADGVDIAFGKGEEKEDINYCIEYNFNYFYLFLGILSVGLYIFDIISDAYLAVKYFEENEIVFGTVTIVLVAGPSLVMCCFGVHWYWIDYDLEQKAIKLQQENKDKHWKPVHLTPKSLWILRIICTIFQIGALLRTVEYLYYGWMSMQASKKKSSLEKVKYHNWMLYEDLDACLLRLFEGFLEAAPQLAFQLYAWATLKPNEDVVSLSIRIISLLLSWGSLAVTLVSYHKSLRYSRRGKKNLSLLATPFYFIWRACEVGARILCISLFAITFELWIFLPVLFHWFIVTCWITQQRTQFYNKFWLEKIFNIICGYIMIFCFLNLREGNTRFRYIIFYVLFYIENFCMIGTWLRFIQSQGAWYDVYGLIAIVVLSILHIAVQLLYYKFFHPEDIKVWLSCNRNLCFESICYKLEPQEEISYIKEQTIVIQQTTRSAPNNSHGNYEMKDLRNEQPLLKNSWQNQTENCIDVNVIL